MSARVKTIIAGAFFSILVIVGAVVAVLVALKQNTTQPVAPTVPQIKPRAAEQTTTPACTLQFTVAGAQTVVCDSLTADVTSGKAPFTVNFTLKGHTAGGGSIVNYKFDFGDGATPVGQTSNTISHQYTSSGTFTAKGTVADNLGNTDGGSGSCQITINSSQITYKFNKCETGVNNSKVCKQEDCVPSNTPCSGLSNCQTDADCQPKFQHKVCLGNSCSSVDCSPPTTQCADSCSTDANCVTTFVPPATPSPTPTHRECRNRACVVVTGAGTDTCSSDVSCQPVAVAPPIPRSGNTAATVGAIVLGIGALAVGLLILL